jgi:hypothetical protein
LATVAQSISAVTTLPTSLVEQEKMSAIVAETIRTAERFGVETTLEASRSFLIERAVQSALGRSQYLSLRLLSCEVSKGRLILKGVVPSYCLKQMAQTLVRKLLPEEHSIDNQMEIGRLEVGAIYLGSAINTAAKIGVNHNRDDVNSKDGIGVCLTRNSCEGLYLGLADKLLSWIAGRRSEDHQDLEID